MPPLQDMPSPQEGGHPRRGADARPQPALVTAAHGRRGSLELQSGQSIPYLVRGRRLQVYCGDLVDWCPGDDGGQAFVTGVHPRRNELRRQPPRDPRPETIATNVTRMAIVMAAVPAPDLFIADRYVCAATLIQAGCAVIWNKSDLVPDAPVAIHLYGPLGIPVFTVAARTGAGLTELAAWLGEGHAVLVGQSGVGKSSLLNALVPGSGAATAGLSTASDEGRHTTTASLTYRLPGGGRLTDTPGVRDFVPAIPDRRDVALGFQEIRAAAPGCRFTDCTHLREPGCAVLALAAAGAIDPRRHESYRRLMTLAGQAAERSAPGPR